MNIHFIDYLFISIQMMPGEEKQLATLKSATGWILTIKTVLTMVLRSLHRVHAMA